MLQLNQELEQDDLWSFRPQVGSPIVNSPPGRVPLNASVIIFTHFTIIYMFSSHKIFHFHDLWICDR